jgi:acetyl-CoA acetyltransferase
MPSGDLARCSLNEKRGNVKEAGIVSAVRTSIGSFRGSLGPLSATKRRSVTIAESLNRINLSGEEVDEVMSSPQGWVRRQLDRRLLERRCRTG